VVDLLKTTGHAVPINNEVRAMRKDLGLDELPPTLYKFKDEPDSELTKYAMHLFNIPQKKEKQA
jgi:heterodisulfide reductase subunit C